MGPPERLSRRPEQTGRTSQESVFRADARCSAADSADSVLRPAILWCDQRTAAECDEITERIGARRLLELTYNKALAGFTAPKILWVRNHEPEIYQNIRKVLLPKDYIRLRMTGEYATEVSDASGTLLFDVKNRTWSQEMLDDLEIPRDWMPDCYESPVVSGRVNASAAEELGIRPGVPVVGGGGDNAAGAVGNGIVRSGLTWVTVGTSGVVFAHMDEVDLDEEGRLHTFCHAVPGKWHVMGVTLSAGGSLQWFRNVLCQAERSVAELMGRDVYELITAEAATAPILSEGLCFLPHLRARGLHIRTRTPAECSSDCHSAIPRPIWLVPFWRAWRLACRTASTWSNS